MENEKWIMENVRKFLNSVVSEGYRNLFFFIPLNFCFPDYLRRKSKP